MPKLIDKFQFGPKKETNLSAVALLLDSARGIYIPQAFADFEKWEGITEEDKETLKAGPDSEFYWDVWETVLNNATFKQDGYTWRLYQDGDLWALCDALMTEEEKRNFGMDDE
jgi:hypothetical protein